MVVPLTVTVPLTGFIALSLSLKVAAVTVLASIGSLNMAVSAEEIDTFVAPLAGIVALTEPERPLSQERSTEVTISPNAACDRRQ